LPFSLISFGMKFLLRERCCVTLYAVAFTRCQVMFQTLHQDFYKISKPCHFWSFLVGILDTDNPIDCVNLLA
jgi:hypothetical protein